jgi:drug/metabolite transporter (DMT)-like permease
MIDDKIFRAFPRWEDEGKIVADVARVGQIQLLQPFFTLAFAAAFLGETFSLSTLLAASLVAISILVGRKAKTLHGPKRPPSQPASSS